MRQSWWRNYLRFCSFPILFLRVFWEFIILYLSEFLRWGLMYNILCVIFWTVFLIFIIVTRFGCYILRSSSGVPCLSGYGNDWKSLTLKMISLVELFKWVSTFKNHDDNLDWLIFNAISTLVGYLMPDNVYIICKQIVYR